MYKLVKYNIKLIFSYNALAAAVYICLSPLFFDFRNMDFLTLAKMGELYLSLSGIILFVSLGNFEVSKYTWEFVYIQPISYMKICLGRLLAIMTFNAFLILIPLSCVYLNSDFLKFFEGYCGIVVTAWFLGLLGLLISEIFQDYKIAYIVTLAYYFIETATKELFGKFQVFGYIHGNINSKYGVFLFCFIMIVIYLLLVKIKYHRGIA